MGPRKKSWLQQLATLAVVTLGVGLIGWLGVSGLARLIFPVRVVHTHDVAAVEAKLRMKLGEARSVEGYFVHAYREWVCWARFEAERDAFQTLLRENGIDGKVQAPWGETERIRKRYGNPGVEGHQLEHWKEWIVSDFLPEGEYKQPNSSMVFGCSKRQPKVVLAYVYGCPKEP